MGSLVRKFSRFAVAAIFAGSLLSVGCAHDRVYDPYYHDYHTWAGENGYYVQWEHDTHRDHVEFEKRNDADKHAYWDWRHSHDQH
jgi:hypothetical protein